MSPRSISILVPELNEPGSETTVRKILRSRDPERALSEQIAQDTMEAVLAARRSLAAGMSDAEEARYFEGIGGLKRYAKKAKRVAKAIVKPVIKVAKKTIEIKKKVIKKIGKGVMPTLKKWAPVIIGVVGAVLAIPTGGLSVAAAAALSAGYGIARQRKEAKKIEKIDKKEAAKINAEVAAQERQVGADLDRLYSENTELFISAGISRADWDKLSIEQKLAVIEKINRGEMPASQPAAEAGAAEQGVPPPTQSQDWMDAIETSPIGQAFRDAAQTVPEEGAPEKREAEAPAAPSGKYELFVEGKKVSESPSMEGLTSAIEEYTKNGDRFMVALDGKPLGLKIRVPGGVISIPAGQVQQVLAMSAEEVQAMVARGSTAAGKGGGGGFPIWVLAIPAAVFIAAKS